MVNDVCCSRYAVILRRVSIKPWSNHQKRSQQFLRGRLLRDQIHPFYLLFAALDWAVIAAEHWIRMYLLETQAHEGTLLVNLLYI